MAGFGRSPFGNNAFGISDTGRDLIVKLWPEEYFDDTLVLQQGETPFDNAEDPLLKFLNTYANSVNLRRLDIENLKTIIDPDQARSDVLLLLGDLFGLDIDKNDPDFLQRTFVKTASQWLQIKGSTKGYQVRGLASGFAVEVDNFWRIIPSYIPLIPPRFVYFLKPELADPTAVPIPHTDQPPGTFAGTPSVEDPTYAKSSYVRVVFTVPIYRPHVDYNKLLDLVILKILDVVAIHHELLPLQFLTRLNTSVTPIANIVRIDETQINQGNVACYFDTIPADYEPLDGCLEAYLSVTVI